MFWKEESDVECRCAFCYELWEGLFEESGSYSAFIDEREKVEIREREREGVMLFDFDRTTIE